MRREVVAGILPALFLLGILLSSVAVGSVAIPSLSNPVVAVAVGNATVASSSVVQLVRSVQVANHYFILHAQYTVTFNGTDLVPAGYTIVSADTWLNSSLPALIVRNGIYTLVRQATCDGNTTPLQDLWLTPSFLFDSQCATLYATANHVVPFGPPSMWINFTATRIIVVKQIHEAEWHVPANGSYALTQNFTVPTPAYLGLTNLTAYENTEVVWCVRYPAGSWDSARTTVYSVNASSFVVPFAQFSNLTIVEWIDASGGNQTYIITLYGVPGTGKGPGVTGNTPPSQITLSTGNITHLTGNVYQASASWTNTYSAPFVGSVILTGSWAATASNQSVVVNSAPVPSAPTGSSVTIPAGSINVTNGTTVIFIVTYTAIPIFSFSGIVAFLGSYGLSIDVIFFFVGMAVVVVLSYLAITRKVGPEKVRSLLPSVVAFALLVIIWTIWIVV